jgi:hypothetical protein
MSFAIKCAEGFCLGTGLILAAAFFRIALHMGIC